jgi:hypothetical protein
VHVEAGLGVPLHDAVLAFDGEPVEVALGPLADRTQLSATVEALDANGEVLLRRIAATNVMAHRSVLLRMRLNDECLPADGEPDVSCTGLTCVAGVCEVPFVGAHLLADYEPSWREAPAGKCGGVDAGEPVVVIGRADPPFTPLEDGDLVTPYMGAQGGTHFFFSVRMNNADDASAITRHHGRVVATGQERSAVSIATPYTVDPDGCHLFHLPFVLPPTNLGGETFRLGVTVADVTGNAGHAHVDVVLTEPLQ